MRSAELSTEPGQLHFDDSWWAGFLPELHRWRATRMRSGDFLTLRAQARFAKLSQAWAAAVEPNLAGDIENVQWSDVSAFPAIVAEIKDVDSPVFASKFCHFLAPRVFPLVDNAAMGNVYPNYAACFGAYKREWTTTTVKGVREELVARLSRLVGASPAEDYPFKNKVVELCLIGRQQGSEAGPGALRSRPMPLRRPLQAVMARDQVSRVIAIVASTALRRRLRCEHGYHESVVPEGLSCCTYVPLCVARRCFP